MLADMFSIFIETFLQRKVLVIKVQSNYFGIFHRLAKYVIMEERQMYFRKAIMKTQGAVKQDLLRTQPARGLYYYRHPAPCTTQQSFLE
jgi:hypothetical protein